MFFQILDEIDKGLIAQANSTMFLGIYGYIDHHLMKKSIWLEFLLENYFMLNTKTNCVTIHSMLK